MTNTKLDCFGARFWNRGGRPVGMDLKTFSEMPLELWTVPPSPLGLVAGMTQRDNGNGDGDDDYKA